MDALLRIGLANALLATLLALVVAAVSRVWRRPALSHGLWLLVLFKLLMPPLIAVPLPWPVETTLEPGTGEVTLSLPNQTDVEPDLVTLPATALEARTPAFEDALSGSLPETIEPKPSQPSFSSDPAAWQWLTWREALAILWLAGSLVWGVLMARRVWRFQCLFRQAEPAPAYLQQQAQGLARRLGIRRTPSVLLVALPISPLVWALARRPRLLLPAELWRRLTTEQQGTLLTHELAHLRRRDHWVRWLELVVLGLYWWHPVVWWARREIQEAEEECCDAWVVWALPEAAQAYAEALLETVAFLAQSRAALPLAASGIGHVQSLKRRLTMIMRATTPRALTWGGILAVLGLGLLLLPLLPTWAENEPPVQELTPFTEPPPATPDKPGTPVVRPPRTVSTEPRHEEPKRNADPKPSPEQLEDARDEVELLKVQLTAKEAELLEARALMQRAQRQLDRMKRLRENNGVGVEELDQAQTEVEVQQARLHGKEAQLQEGRVRLRQAERRLAVLQDLRKPAARPATKAPEKPDRPAPGTTPGGGADIPPPVRSRPPASSDNTRGSGAQNEQRLNQLEMKLQALLDEMAALRKEMHAGQAGNPYQPILPYVNNIHPGPTPNKPRELIVPYQQPPRREDPRSVPTVPLAPSRNDSPDAVPQVVPVTPDKNQQPVRP